MKPILDRIRDPSTWAGIGVLAGVFGLQIAPDSLQLVTQIGTGIAGLLAIYLLPKPPAGS